MSECYKLLKREYQGVKLKFAANESTYKPDKFTKLMADSIRINKNDLVCDVGTGSGALAILASKLGAKKAYGIDIMDEFRNTFEENCLLNNVKNAVFVKSDLLKNFRKKADVMIVNMAQTPFYKKISKSKWGGKDGADNVIGIIKSSKKNLKPKGKLILGIVSLSNPSRILTALTQEFNYKLISSMKRYFTRESSERWKKGFHDYLLKQREVGQSKFYKDKNKFYYYFYVYECALKSKRGERNDYRMSLKQQD